MLVWLICCAAMVIGMMLIGAVTRLTESGLSMVEWRPLIGVLPPLSGEEWERVFGLYRQTSEYRIQNPDMTLGEFKTIFWWEYIHRLWGRLIGVVFAVPLAYFWATGRIAPHLRLPLLGAFLLGGLQGLIGWWMVKSGFVERDDVSQYRLVIHLGMAFFILGYLLWIALGLTRFVVADGASPVRVRRLGWWVLATIAATLASGGLVAGLNAAFAYNTWPLMEGAFVPADYAQLSPYWRNLFENVAAVQFDHRLLAYLTAAMVVSLWVVVRRPGTGRSVRRLADLMLLMVGLQAALGIATLLLVVPIGLAVLHQAGAIALFCLAVSLVRIARGRPSGAAR